MSLLSNLLICQVQNVPLLINTLVEERSSSSIITYCMCMFLDRMSNRVHFSIAYTKAIDNVECL